MYSDEEWLSMVKSVAIEDQSILVGFMGLLHVRQVRCRELERKLAEAQANLVAAMRVKGAKAPAKKSKKK